MIPQRCWRSSAERFIESSALCGHFLSRKLNSVHKGRFHVKVKRNTHAVRHELRQGGIRRPPEIIIHTVIEQKANSAQNAGAQCAPLRVRGCFFRNVVGARIARPLSKFMQNFGFAHLLPLPKCNDSPKNYALPSSGQPLCFSSFLSASLSSSLFAASICGVNSARSAKII